MAGQMTNKRAASPRVFGWAEMVFDLLYLAAACLLGIYFTRYSPSPIGDLAVAMAFVLVGGDLFHLVPRMLSIYSGDERRYAAAMGIGKLITSITMTIFYVLLWYFGLFIFGLEGNGAQNIIIWALAALRCLICLFPQNRWLRPDQPFGWALARNLPFLALGAMCAAMFFEHASIVPALSGMWLAIALSFIFYLPVALWAGKNRKIGMLMLPKTCMYIWMLLMVYHCLI